MSNTNKNFAEAMTRLEEEDPTSYKAISRRFAVLKSEAAKWRRQAQGLSPSVIELKEAFDGRQVEQQ